ncbi:MAG: SDR family NAD(P)-dependent oxidoreductase, partial [Myxococcota bacterium]|nr:SDR family NAD(P)-dependent oxidoreductase [Myxococcota bacterium]
QFPRTHIDALVHNAGVLPSERILSPQGFEQCFACNVLGPYALTQHLRPMLSEKSRIVFVSSGGMYPTRLSLSLLENPKTPYSGLQAYSMTKRAQVVLAELWQQSLPSSVYSMHPGWADTPAVRTSIPRFYRSTQNILRTPEQGADTLFYLLANDSPPPAGFYFDRKIQNPYPLPFTKESPQTRRELLPLLHRYIDAHASSSPREAQSKK